MMPHRVRLQFGRRDPNTSAYGALLEKRRTLADRFLAFRRAVRAADQSVDTFMRRGETTTRFHYFGEGETP